MFIENRPVTFKNDELLEGLIYCYNDGNITSPLTVVDEKFYDKRNDNYFYADGKEVDGQEELNLSPKHMFIHTFWLLTFKSPGNFGGETVMLVDIHPITFVNSLKGYYDKIEIVFMQEIGIFDYKINLYNNFNKTHIPEDKNRSITIYNAKDYKLTNNFYIPDLRWKPTR